jgi:hypothetical protein
MAGSLFIYDGICEECGEECNSVVHQTDRKELCCKHDGMIKDVHKWCLKCETRNEK